MTRLQTLCRIVPCFGVACLLLPATAHAAAGNSQSKGKIASGLSISNVAALDFGTLVPSTGGTASVNAQTGVRTTAGAVVAAGGTVSRALFTFVGTPGRVVTLGLSPSPTITITRVGGTETMTINQVRVSANGGTPQPVGPNHTLPPTGIFLLGVGGRLNVNANQVGGDYAGTFTVTINYQ